MNGEIAVAVVTATAPGVHGEAKSTLDGPGGLVASRMPVLLPLHHLSRNRQFIAISVGALSGEFQVAGDQVHRVHVHLRRQILNRTHGDNGSLRMGWRAPGAGASLVGRDGDVLFALIWNVKDVGQRRRAASAHSAGSPG